MENINELILNHFKNNQKYIKTEELKRKLKIKGEEQTMSFHMALKALEEDGSLFFSELKGYRLFTNEPELAFAKLEVSKSGHGFAHTNDGRVIFIDKDALNGALDEDHIIVDSIIPGTQDDYKGKVKKIVKRNKGEVIYEVIGNADKAILKPYNSNQKIKVKLSKNELKTLVDGEIIIVKVSTDKEEDKYLGELKKVIGHKNDPGMDIRLIYEKNEIPIEFSDEALEEANNLPAEVSEHELVDRVDLRDKPIITIDCDTTKDRDDAVYVELLENGNYKLYTSIAHISHYIKKDSSLYKEASLRSTSHYPNNTCNPMFPPKVSNGICSLNENVDRLTRTVEMEFDLQGNLVDYQIYASVINSKKAMKYSEVNRVLAGEPVAGYEPFVDQLKLMEQLNNIFEKHRNERNCLDFDVPELEVVHTEDGKVEGVIESPTGKSQRIIENFMVATNTTVAESYSWIPFIYRVHETPEPDTVANAIKILKSSGFSIPSYTNINEATLKSILEKINTSEEAKIIREMLLKSMKQARYDVHNIGHFALQLQNYSHFTSPIRRYTDFRIHTLLDELDTFDYSEESTKNLEEELIEIAKHASNIERKAKEIEREAIMMSMAEYMENHIGGCFNGIITEVHPHGMVVRTDNMITGKVKFNSLKGDKYYYDANHNAIIGKNHHKKYQIGNKVYVMVKEANKATRVINFEFSKRKVLKKEQ